MASVYSKSLQIHNAEQFKFSVESPASPYLYFTFGKVQPWSNEAAPPQANTSVAEFFDIWKNMIGAKQIQGNDVRLAVYRHDWKSGEQYNAYDDCACSLDQNDANNKFYVLTDDWNVYKCLGNNNGGISTVKPTSTITNFAIETADKYVWKYMYTLSDEERLRFVTDNYIPVKTLTEDNGSLQWIVQNDAIAGAIESIKVTNPGVGYTTAPIITITGDGTEAAAIARLNTASNTVESIIMTNLGSGYTTANVTITGATGAGATAQVVISPKGGHGSDPVEELGGSYVIINTRLRGTETDVLDVANEFRQVAIIKNPKLKNQNVMANNVVYSQTTKIYVQNLGSEFQEDEIVFQGSDLTNSTFSGRVVSWNSTERKLELIDVKGVPRSGLISGVTSQTSRQYDSYVDQDLQPYSGSMLYKDNIIAIQRAEDQTEDFKIVVGF